MLPANSVDRNQLMLSLSSEQQIAVFHESGFLVRRLEIDPTTGLGRAIDRCCSRCLLADDLPDVWIDATGICNHCRDFEGQDQQGTYDPARVLRTIAECRGPGVPDSVVAFSGGKDSAATLLAAVEMYGLRPLAVLVDNGFVPDEVKEQSRVFCERLGVPLEIRSIDIGDLVERTINGHPNVIPCHACIRKIFGVVGEVCKALGISVVLGGHRFPPLSYPVSAFTRDPRHQGIICVSPLLGLRMTEPDQLAYVARAGWHPVAIAGNTSNCRLIGYVERLHFDAFNFSPHLYEVSKEIRAGIYSRAYGINKVERPNLTRDHEREVEEKARAARSRRLMPIVQPEE